MTKTCPVNTSGPSPTLSPVTNTAMSEVIGRSLVADGYISFANLFILKQMHVVRSEVFDGFLQH